MSTNGIGRLSVGAAVAGAVLALVAGCASSSNSAKPAAGASQAAQSTVAAGGSASGLKTRSTSIGTVLVDSSGRTVYELVGDSAANQTCDASCLAIWPAVTSNGTQLILNGHPVFTYTGDTAAGQTKGQNLTDKWGLWLALDPSGNPVSAAVTPSSPSATTKAPAGGGPAF